MSRPNQPHSTQPDSNQPRPTLYEAAGGAAALRALAADFHARCLADPVLEHPFSHTENPEHVERLADYWGEVLGGPARYTDGHAAMIRLHARQGAESDLGERFVARFVEAIDGAGLPEDPELRAALTAYMRWATDEVMAYSPPDSPLPADLPMPHWDWDGLRAD